MPLSAPFSLLSLGPIINRWKYLVGAALVLALVISAIAALRLPNIYTSKAVFYPTNLQSVDPDRLVEGSKMEISTKGEDLDRVITIGTSQPVAELIIKRFDLYTHYKAGRPGDDAAENFVLNEFSSNLSIVHNDRDAIELTFQDPDKQLAARVANAMVEVIDSLNQQLTLESRRQILQLYKQRYAYFNTTFEQSRRQLRRELAQHGEVLGCLVGDGGDQRLAAHLVQRVLGLAQPIGRVDVDQDQARLGGGELGQRPLRAVGRPDADPIARLQSQRQQAGGQGLDPGLHLHIGPADLLMPRDQRQDVRMRRAGRIERSPDCLAQQRLGARAAYVA